MTYAGGARSLEDLALVNELGQGRVDLAIGSALDIFGGKLPYRDVVPSPATHAIWTRLKAGDLIDRM